ncbi:hypothetical protein GCM10010174_59130 [Kutzneria viridogrisea]|uniref:Uncharacterized protein n=1 Tax=Kutzneria viridogrisea TaxID=47990 RepID=A0ABR6BK14_9PSEU|nr:hypothetical protein [Kutzneria viridogrisea]
MFPPHDIMVGSLEIVEPVPKGVEITLIAEPGTELLLPPHGKAL